MLSLALAFRERRKAGAIVTLRAERDTHKHTNTNTHGVETSREHYSTGISGKTANTVSSVVGEAAS